MDAPGICVFAADGRRADLEAAVAAAGGALTPATRADAIVWAKDEPPALARVLHPGIRWVQLSSAGIEDWFTAGVIDRERIWTAAKGVYAAPIAEYCVGMILAGLRGLPEAVRSATWRPVDARALAGSTVAVLGAGGIGAAVLALLAPLRAHGIAVTRTGRGVPGAARSVGPAVLDQVLAAADAVVVSMPETAETIGVVSRARLERMKHGAILVNIARGRLVDADALVDALREGRLAAAFLDVTDPEPLPDGHPLWSLPNAVVTSHTASTQALGTRALADRVFDNVSRFARGMPLLGTVDVDAGY